MHVLFVHQNFPAQFRCIAPRLAQNFGWRCTFATRNAVVAASPGVEKVLYRLRGGAHALSHHCTRGFENEIAHAGDDSNLVGTDNADTIWGNAGNDILWGADGNDIMYGGYGGQDDLHGDNDNDIMYGGDGGAGGNVEVEADRLWGGFGNDTLYGEGGNDEIRPEGGVDVAYGGAGDDTFRSSLDTEFDWLDGGSGTDNAGTSGVDYDAITDSLMSFP